MKNTIFFFLISFNLFSQELVKKIIICDNISKVAIPYVNVNFLNGYGVYSNELGIIDFKSNFPQSVQLSCLGYKSRNVNFNNVLDTIFLEENEVVLNEVVLKYYKKIIKNKYVHKVKVNNSLNKCLPVYIGFKVAFFLDDDNKNGILKKISIPVLNKEVQSKNQKGILKNDYKTLIKVEILKNFNGLPSTNFENFEKYLIINSDEIDNDINIDFLEQIEIPNEGFFVAVTFVGNIDTTGNLIIELPYYIYKKVDKLINIAKPILPYICLTEDDISRPSYVNYIFNSDSTWEKIDRYPFDRNNNKSNNKINIGFGYEIEYYE